MNRISIITTLLLVIVLIYLGSTHSYWNPSQYDIIETKMVEESEAHWNTITKETKDWTGSHQGVEDTSYWQQEEDSINAYMRHWYGVLDTNSDGDIDNCGEYNNSDSIVNKEIRI